MRPSRIIAPLLPSPLFDMIKAVYRSVEIKRRRDMAFWRPEDLVGVMPANCYTSDGCANSFYSLSEIMKRFAGVSLRLRLQGIIEHGMYATNYILPNDLNHIRKGVITMGPHRLPVLHEHVDCPVYCVGPYIRYAPPLLDPKRTKREKERLGRNLLAFPSHSYADQKVLFDKSSFADYIGQMGRDYDSIRICLHPRDVQLGAASFYRDLGMECVTAGNIYDVNFLSRLRSIIDCSTMTVSNGIGTHAGYCLGLQKPHHFFVQQVDHTDGDSGVLSVVAEGLRLSPLFGRIIKLLSQRYETYDDIPPEALEIADQIWGLSDTKTPGEMKEILCSLV